MLTAPTYPQTNDTLFFNMGKKDRRDGNTSISSLKRNDSLSTTSSISPKTTPHKRGTFGSFTSALKMSGPPTKPVKDLNTAVSNVSLGHATTPGRPDLCFKSLRTGTLKKKNGEPTTAFIEPFPPAKKSVLSATVPSFVPKTPSPLNTPANAKIVSSYGLPTPQTPEFMRVQNLLQDLRSSPAGGYGGYGGGNYGQGHSHPQAQIDSHAEVQGQYQQPIAQYPSPPRSYRHGIATSHTPLPTTYPASSYAFPPTTPPQPQAIPSSYTQALWHYTPRVFIAKKHKSKADILITATGVMRNAVRVIERRLANGHPYQTSYDEYNSETYDFMAEWKGMTEKEKKEFLGKNTVDITVRLKAPEEEREMEQRAATLEKMGESKGKGRGQGKWKEKEQSSSTDVENAAEVQEKETTVIDTWKALGPEFAALVKRMTITLAFPPLPAIADTPISSGAGTIRQMRVPPPTGPQAQTPNLRHLTTLVSTLHPLPSLASLTLILLVPSTSRMPLCLPQLFHVLPFYELEFTEWEIKYQPDNLSKPLRVHGWAVGQLDRERDRIVGERLRGREEKMMAERRHVVEERKRLGKEKRKEERKEEERVWREGKRERKRVEDAVFVTGSTMLKYKGLPTPEPFRGEGAGYGRR